MSVRLWCRLKDLRLGFFTLMVVLMFGRQAMTLVQSVVESGGPIFSLRASHTVELPGLVVSVMAVLAVHYLGRMIEDRRRVGDESYQLSVAMRHAMSGVAWVDSGGRFTHVNAGYAKSFGYVPSEMVGTPWMATVYPDDRHEAKRGLESMDARGAAEIETRVVRRDGTRFDQSLLMVKPKDRAGKSQGAWFCCMRNITKRKEAQRALRESERRYRLLFSRAPISIWEEDVTRVGAWLDALKQQGVSDLPAYLDEHPDALAHAASLVRVVDVNDATVRMFEGRSKAEVMTKFPTVLGGESYESFAEELQAIWDGRDCVEHPVTGRTLRGQVRHKIVHWAVPRVDGELDLQRVVVVVSDITEHHRAQEKLRRYAHDLECANLALREATAEARTATEAKSEFLANMSHEIRTPLTAIMGYTELLGDSQGLDDDDRESLRTIHRNGEHLLRVINDILDLSKIESGKMSLERVDAEPRELCNGAVGLLRGRAEAKGLALSVVFVPPVPEVIQTDPTRLRQVLVNLVGNAIKFTDRGSVRVVVKPGSCPETRRGMLCLDVQDTGIGLTGEQMTKLFRPFSQADTSTTRRFGGTGLGLTISRRIAKLLGGGIEVHSEHGVGSTFTITVVADHGSHDQADPAVPTETMLTEDPDAPALNVTIGPVDGRVLIGGNGVQGAMMAGLVEKMGAQAVVAHTGYEAYRAIQDHAQRGEPFDLVLMDMQAPELNGYAITRRLRWEGHREPVVGLTDGTLADDHDRALWAGCSDHLSKPIRRHQLAVVVDKYLGSGSGVIAVGHDGRDAGGQSVDVG